MPGLRGFLFNQDIGVTSTGHKLHIVTSLAEHILTAAEIFEVVGPTFVVPAGVSGAAAAGEGAYLVLSTPLGLSMAFTGPVVGMAGVFMALGSGYAEAREMIKKEAIASGFAQGFVAGLLNMSPQTVKYLFARHGVPAGSSDPEAEIIEMKAHNKGLVAGYTMANQVSADDKKAYLAEIRQYTGRVPVGDWTDRDKVDYVITYAAKLRLHFLQQ